MDTMPPVYKEQLLHKAIDKARRNGWLNTSVADIYPKAASFGHAGPTASVNSRVRNYRALLFSQDFAKAFWGEKNEPTRDGDCVHCGQVLDLGAFWTIVPCWQYALQQMALEDDPLKYLERFLDPVNRATIHGVAQS